jgi:hypothetical protein
MVKLPPWYTSVDAESASHIIKRTRAPTDHRISPEKLAKDLNWAFFGYIANASIDARSRAQSYRNLKLITSRAKALNLALVNSEDVRPYIGHAAVSLWQSEGRAKFKNLVAALWSPEAEERIGATDAVSIAYKAIELFVEWGEEAIRRGPPRKPSLSPIEELIAVTLPQIYLDHFWLRFGAGTAGDSQASGPGIRFVIASLDAGSITGKGGRSYSVETVRTYWQNIQRGKRRRAPDKTS